MEDQTKTNEIKIEVNGNAWQKEKKEYEGMHMKQEEDIKNLKPTISNLISNGQAALYMASKNKSGKFDMLRELNLALQNNQRANAINLLEKVALNLNSDSDFEAILSSGRDQIFEVLYSASKVGKLLVNAVKDGKNYNVNEILLNLQPSSNGITEAMINAAENGNVDIMVLFLNSQRIKDKNPKLSNNGVTPMHYAAREGHVEVLKLLLDCPDIKDKNPKDNDRCTPMHYSAWKGHVEAFNHLFECPDIKDKNPKSHNGMTPMHYAAQEGHVEVFDQLLECQDIKDKNPKSNNGNTPMHSFAWNRQVKVLKLLLDCPEIKDKNPNNKSGWTPMHYAATNGHVEVLKLFLDCPDIKEKNPKDTRWGNTPLSLAKTYQHQQSIELLQKYARN